VKSPPSFDLERVALLLAEALGENGMLVGGMAVGAHGYVRATDDVDFVARMPLTDVRKRLQTLGIKATVHKGNVLDGDFDCLKGTVDGVRFDVMPPLVALEWDRAIEVPMTDKRRLRVVDLDGLIRLKLRAQGPRDLMDVAALTLRHPERLAAAREAARSYGALDRLDHWLADPRLRAELLETGRRQKARKGPRNSGRRRSGQNAT
jgi:hypothetical protein